MDYNKNLKIDLHIHSTASDGTFTPAQILAMAEESKIAAIAITDHDTIDGTKEALACGIPPSVKFLTGVEISTAPPPACPLSGSLHILGYAIQLDDPVLNLTLNRLQDARKNRNPKIIKRLNNLGVDITLEQVQKEAGEDGQLGRPHIARVMVKRGFAESIDDAFGRYLGTGKSAYVNKYRVECDKAIKIIIEAGGVPVLAHPVLVQMEEGHSLEELVALLTSMGLRGIEVYYPEHTPEAIDFYTRIAKRYSLLMTGGSDFHGSLKPKIKLGTGKGDLFVPYEVFEKLLDAAHIK